MYGVIRETNGLAPVGPIPVTLGVNSSEKEKVASWIPELSPVLICKINRPGLAKSSTVLPTESTWIVLLPPIRLTWVFWADNEVALRSTDPAEPGPPTPEPPPAPPVPPVPPTPP